MKAKLPSQKTFASLFNFQQKALIEPSRAWIESLLLTQL